MLSSSLVPNLNDSPKVREAKRAARAAYFAVKRANRARNGKAYR